MKHYKERRHCWVLEGPDEKLVCHPDGEVLRWPTKRQAQIHVEHFGAYDCKIRKAQIKVELL